MKSVGWRRFVGHSAGRLLPGVAEIGELVQHIEPERRPERDGEPGEYPTTDHYDPFGCVPGAVRLRPTHRKVEVLDPVERFLRPDVGRLATGFGHDRLAD